MEKEATPERTDKPWIENGSLVALYIVITVFLGWIIGVIVGQKALLPVLTAALFYPIFAHRLMRSRLGSASGWAMFWVFCMTVAGIAFTISWPRIFSGAWAGKVDQAVAQGGEYTKNMFVWIDSGVGAESDPSRFIPMQLRNLGWFVMGSAFSGGALGLIFGAMQLNYMNFYVGELAIYSHSPFLAVLLGWPPYSLVRVVGFIILATGLAAPLVCLVTHRKIPWAKAVRFAVIGVVLAGLDLLLKWMIAPMWREVLRGVMPSLVGGSAG